MYCLHCGDCCTRMCPMNGGKCDHVKKEGTFYFCGIYESRPKECANHKFDMQFCPVGMSTLKMYDINQLIDRVKTGNAIIRKKANK